MTTTTVEPTVIRRPANQTALVVPPGEVDYLADVRRVARQVEAIHELMKSVMKKDVHYGVIPGTEKKDPRTHEDISKPALYQPGADLLLMVFQLRPEYTVAMVERDDFIMATVTCRLVHRPTGMVIAEGIGTSNSRESKYRSRTTIKTCPKCGAATIYASKKDPGWFCWGKQGGCGAQFKIDDPEIVSQAEQYSTAGVYDNHNTIVKIGVKRSKMSAVGTATGASNVFDVGSDDDRIDEREAMTAVQWNLIQGEQKRMGISGVEFLNRFVIGLCEREGVKDLTFSDAVKILDEIKKVAPADAKPKTADDAVARARKQREASAKPAAATTPAGSTPPAEATKATPPAPDPRLALMRTVDELVFATKLSTETVAGWFGLEDPGDAVGRAIGRGHRPPEAHRRRRGARPHDRRRARRHQEGSASGRHHRRVVQEADRRP